MNNEEMNELARQERNRYFREYRERNPDKVREANRKYWERRAAKAVAEKEARNAAANENH